MGSSPALGLVFRPDSIDKSVRTPVSRVEVLVFKSQLSQTNDSQNRYLSHPSLEFGMAMTGSLSVSG